jgi:hypothetical protein
MNNVNMNTKKNQNEYTVDGWCLSKRTFGLPNNFACAKIASIDNRIPARIALLTHANNNWFISFSPSMPFPGEKQITGILLLLQSFGSKAYFLASGSSGGISPCFTLHWSIAGSGG